MKRNILKFALPGLAGVSLLVGWAVAENVRNARPGESSTPQATSQSKSDAAIA